MCNEIISVIIPIYNRERYIRRCIDSVLNQQNVETEIILVDDGSTDSSPQIIKEYASNYSNIKPIFTPNQGVSHARNTGLDAANGKYIAFIDSDDFLEPDALISMKTAIEKNGADCCVGRINFYSDSGDFDHTLILPDQYRNKLFDNTEVWQTLLDIEYPILDICNSKLFLAKLWKTIRFPEGKTSEDTFSIIEIYEKCDKVYFLDKVVYNLIFSPSSIMRSKPCKYLIDSSEANCKLSAHLIKKGFYNAALKRFGDGTRNLIYAKETLKDPEYQAEIHKVYKQYCLVSKRLSSHVSIRNKIRFFIFRLSFPLYIFIRTVKVKTCAAR